MTGAINYMRRKGRYVMKYYLVAVISIWRPHRTFHSNVKHGGIGVFIIFYSRLFADITLFLLNRKKRQCDKYYNGVPNSKMSDVKNIYFVYSLFQIYSPK